MPLVQLDALIFVACMLRFRRYQVRPIAGISIVQSVEYGRETPEESIWIVSWPSIWVVDGTIEVYTYVCSRSLNWPLLLYHFTMTALSEALSKFRNFNTGMGLVHTCLQSQLDNNVLRQSIASITGQENFMRCVL